MPQHSAGRADRAISANVAIEMLNLVTREKIRIPVYAKIDGSPVTPEMLTEEVRLLNKVCGLHGKTMARLPNRKLFFRALTL